ncbi:NADH:ubiquinone oxidoreductase [Mortierella polycephala]|uniref:NADH:ubiquinone oxidoreductase n=1 Tax=Mortierella polycephala TaxID=41804 RepID=A0A9P6PRX0_9FUNG|nr:NADH:ubiquinone oxidoreductase [Mortierella polycephala]
MSVSASPVPVDVPAPLQRDVEANDQTLEATSGGDEDKTEKCNISCNRLYSPVCGQRKSGERRTFGNSCVLKAYNCSNPNYRYEIIAHQNFQSVAEELEFYKERAGTLEDELNETRYTLEEFQLSSKELEEELEKEIDSTERRYNEIKIRNEAMRQEAEDWKEKYHQAIKDSNVNINQLSRQLEVLKQQTEMFVKKERELEQDNDDLERTGRAASWSLKELENKYNAAVERTAILEGEVATKAALSEDVQRLKDELRDTNVELAVMKSNQAGMNGSSASSSSLEGSTASLTDSQPQRPTIGSSYEAMPSLRARLAKNSALQRSSARVAAPAGTSPSTTRTFDKSATPPQNPVRMVQDMVGRVKSLEARLVSCRSLVTPLLQPPPSYSTSNPSSGQRNSWQGSSANLSTLASSRSGSPTAASSTATSPKVTRRTSLLLQQHLQQHREQREQQKLREQQRAIAESSVLSS